MASIDYMCDAGYAAPPKSVQTDEDSFLSSSVFVSDLDTARREETCVVLFCSPRRRATDGGAFGLLQAVWEPPVSLCYQFFG